MYDITDANTNGEPLEDEYVEPARQPMTKRLLDMEVAVISGLPMKTVNEVTAIFLDLAMTAIADRGELDLHRFGRFTLKQYKGKALAQEQLGKKVPRARQKMRDINKHEIRFKKSRGFRRRLRDMGW
jgi:nucleoid DNA-binding protein